MEYVIKSNVPDMGIAAKCLYPTKEKAVIAFKGIYKKLSQKCPPPICTLRNEESDNIRGTIQIYVDGFCYYVELFMSMIEEPIKRGRPKRVQSVKRVNFHLDADLYAIADQRRGNMTMTLFLNSVIRKALAK